MRIIQVIDTLNIGGAEKMLVITSNLLVDYGIDVSVLLISDEGCLLKELNDNIKIYKLKRNNKFSLSKMRHAKEILNEFDIVHTHLKHNFRYIKAIDFLFNLRCKIILHDHSHNFHHKRSLKDGVKNFIFNFFLKPDFYIGVSNENLKWADKAFNISDDRKIILGNVVNKLSVVIDDKDKVPNTVVLVSNIRPIKNIAFALEFISTIDWNLDIYGKIYDANYLEQIEAKIIQLNIAERVRIISDVNEVQKILPKYSFAIFTSLKETGPITIIEYLAQGVPFLTYNTGQVNKIIENELPLSVINNFDIDLWNERFYELINIDSSDILKSIYDKYFKTENYLTKCLEVYKFLGSY